MLHYNVRISRVAYTMLGMPHRGYPTHHSPPFKLNKEAIRRFKSEVRRALDHNPDLLCMVLMLGMN